MGAPRFRAGVIVAVRDSRNRVLAFERCDTAGAWQLPQGGIDSGETALQAAWRELGEETGLGPDQVVCEGPIGGWTVYELPPQFRRGDVWGQAHLWFGFRVVDDDVEPVCDGTEFGAWRWMNAADLIDQVVEFRRPGYQQVLGHG